MAKRNGQETKAEVKKVMKAVVAEKVDYTDVRKLFNKVITMNKGLTLVENKHGAIQIKNEDGLLFSARSDGRMIITHPIMDGKVRVFKHPGDKWDHLSQVPFKDVTLKMLEARVKDPKTSSDYYKSFYAKDMAKSGLFQKAEAARNRVAKLKKEAGSKKTDAKVVIREAKEAKASKKNAKITAKAIRKVAAKAVA